MTIRTELARKKRRVILTAILGVAVFIAGTYVQSRSAEFPLSPLLGFGVTTLAMMYAYIDIKCPKCNNSLGQLVLCSGRPFSVPEHFRYCPYCGIDIDAAFSRVHPQT